ncbi:MAG: hypothetical protein AB9866_28150 [Syntrophobacteraceae bacterium]
MSHSLRLSDFFEGKKYPGIALTASVIIILLLELAIYAAIAGQSGLKTRVVVSDSNGTKIYESSGTALTSYEKMVFESNFGPLRNFNTRVDSEMVPFAYRTWILLATGVPLGLILMIYFLVQVWLTIFGGNQKDGGPTASDSGKNRLDSFMSASRNISPVHVGFVIVMAMLILWLIPSVVGDVIRSGFDVVKEYPWFFLGLALFTGGLLVWVIYLRYRLSKQMLSNQLEIEKCRIQTQLLAQNPAPHLLASPGAEAEEHGVQLLKTRES